MIDSYLYAVIVKIIHILFIIFILSAPFINNECVLSIHFMLIILMWAHWLTNTDHCSLTLLEKAIRGVDDNQSFLAKIISPIYTVNTKITFMLTYGITGVLFVISTTKLRNHNFEHLREAFKLILSYFVKYKK